MVHSTYYPNFTGYYHRTYQKHNNSKYTPILLDLIYTNTNFGSEESKLISTEYLNIGESYIDSISIYPKPADNFIYIRYQNILPESYKIFDLNGRLIQSKIIKNDDDLEIKISGFEKGLYFISIRSGKNMEHLKFLVK